MFNMQIRYNCKFFICEIRKLFQFIKWSISSYECTFIDDLSNQNRVLIFARDEILLHGFPSGLRLEINIDYNRKLVFNLFLEFYIRQKATITMLNETETFNVPKNRLRASSDFAAGQVCECISTAPVTYDLTSLFHLRQRIASCSAKSRYVFGH